MGASRVRADAYAYVLDVTTPLIPELAVLLPEESDAGEAAAEYLFKS